MLNELSDDELLNVPLANLEPGELRRAFQAQSVAAVKKQEEEAAQWRMLSIFQHRKEDEANREREELHRREEILLAALRDREKIILEEAEVLNKRTIKLDDGRRAYVDRDKFRDAEGRELHGADRAQAELHRLDQPDAATWQEYRDVDRRWRAAEELRGKVEALHSAADNADSAKALGAYEKSFKSEVADNPMSKESTPDYGSADYMSAYGLSGGFQQAATGASSRISLTPLPAQPASQKTNVLAPNR